MMPSSEKLKRIQSHSPKQKESVKLQSRSTTTPTSFVLPNELVDDLNKTKFALQRETGRRRDFSVSSIARAALTHFIGLEMDEQVQLIEDVLHKSTK